MRPSNGRSFSILSESLELGNIGCVAPIFLPFLKHLRKGKRSFIEDLLLTTKKKCEEAIECYTNAIELKPDFAEAYDSRGLAKRALGNNEEAEKDLKRAQRI